MMSPISMSSRLEKGERIKSKQFRAGVINAVRERVLDTMKTWERHQTQVQKPEIVAPGVLKGKEELTRQIWGRADCPRLRECHNEGLTRKHTCLPT